MYMLLLMVIILNAGYIRGNPVVSTKYGPVEGLSIPIHTGQIIDAFMAIPYAKPPVDELRFMQAEEPTPWNDSFLAHAPGNACVQWKVNTVLLTHWGYDKFDEDCLTVNIYKPQADGDVLLPVLVFIHGGDFKGGANFGNPGYFQAAYGVVVVTINYRLGILGFATTEDEVLPGNLGLFDQALALKFIQENIEAFGGDPTRVTISGESAGGASVGFHLLSSVSTGLFHQAILQSGSELAYWSLQVPEEQPSDYLRQVAEKVNCPTESSAEMVECLRTVSAQRLVSTRYNCTEGYDCGTFRPTIDGTFLTDYPNDLRERGEYNKVPEMIGMNENDGSLIMLLVNPFLEDGLTREELDEAIIEGLEEVAPSWPDPSRLEDAIQSMRFYYADWPYYDDLIACRNMLSKLFTDLWFGYTADMQGKSHSDDSPVYYYVYDYTYPDSNIPDYFGTFHGAEITFQFGWPFFEIEDNEIAYNHSEIVQPPDTEVDITEFDEEFSHFMMTLWTNFAKYGNPTPDPVGPGNSSKIQWPQFSRDNLTYAYLSADPEIRIDYRQQDYAYWREYLRYITHGETFFTEKNSYETGAGAFGGRLSDDIDHVQAALLTTDLDDILY